MNIKQQLKNSLIIKWIKNNLGLSIVGGVVVLGGVTTSALVATIKEPWYKVLMINVQGGPNGAYDEQGYQYFPCVKTSDNGGIVNGDIYTSYGDNSPYVAEILARSINGGDYPKTHNGMAWVKWNILNDDGAKLPSWLSIGKIDDENYGKLKVDFSKVTHEENFWVMTSCELGGVKAYARILHVNMEIHYLG